MRRSSFPPHSDPPLREGFTRCRHWSRISRRPISPLISSILSRSIEQEMRTLAQEMRDFVARASMLEIADQYDRLALRSEGRLRFLKTAA